MKALILLTLVLGSVAQADVYVAPHVQSDGTYVPGHYRTAPDGNPFNNYTAQGNANPYTGAAGTVNPAPNQLDTSIILGVQAPKFGNTMDYALQAAQIQQMQLQNQAMQNAMADRQAYEAAMIESYKRETARLEEETRTYKAQAAEFEKQNPWAILGAMNKKAD